MLFTHTTFIGIDPTAGIRPINYAALDDGLKLLAMGEGSLDDILAFTAGQQHAYVAITAPRRPNIGLMAKPEIRQALSPPPIPGRWTNFRLCEYLLRQHNLHIPRTPGEDERAPNWMRTGFQLYQRLNDLGYRPFGREAVERYTLEVYPHACFSAMLGIIPFHKATLEGRLQRQLVLFDANLDIPDPMHFFEEITRNRILRGILPGGILYTSTELDALVAAYTAWMIARHRDQVSVFGDIDEGEIIVPLQNLKQRYS
jgi:hypothetical protein